MEKNYRLGKGIKAKMLFLVLVFFGVAVSTKEIIGLSIFMVILGITMIVIFVLSRNSKIELYQDRFIFTHMFGKTEVLFNSISKAQLFDKVSNRGGPRRQLIYFYEDNGKAKKGGIAYTIFENGDELLKEFLKLLPPSALKTEKKLLGKEKELKKG